MKLPGQPQYVDSSEGDVFYEGQLCTIEELKEFARDAFTAGLMSLVSSKPRQVKFQDFWQQITEEK